MICQNSLVKKTVSWTLHPETVLSFDRTDPSPVSPEGEKLFAHQIKP
jgi:hypothetical protein